MLYLLAAAGTSWGDLSLESTGRKPANDEIFAPIVGTGLEGSYVKVIDSLLVDCTVDKLFFESR